jgi:hypothetical protein
MLEMMHDAAEGISNDKYNQAQFLKSIFEKQSRQRSTDKVFVIISRC